jgi:UDP-glucose:(heptosyl)LPS alpha-1,3-glucosyltransferase
MKLALVRQRYNPYGGAERFVERAVSALADLGVSVTVVARDWTAAPSADMTLLSCNPFYFGRRWRDRSFAQAVCHTLSRQSFDLVQSHERLSCCDVYRAGDGVHAQWLANRARLRSDWQAALLAYSPYHRALLQAEREMYASPRLRAVICNSRMVAEEVAHWYQVPQHKLRLIYNGIDLQSFHPGLCQQHAQSIRAAHAIPAQAPLLLFVGAGFERKGVARLLQALALLQTSASVATDRAPRLVVVGADKSLPAMQRLTQRLGLAARVLFTGGLPDVRPWYGAADCLVLPTLYDPFPNAALEALASGVPVITSRQCGAAELLMQAAAAGEPCGAVCDALDVPALAALMDQPREHWLAQRAAARHLAEGYGLPAMAAQLAALYRELLGR